MTMFLDDGRLIGSQHQITAAKDAYTAKPNWMQLCSLKTGRAPRACAPALEALQNTARGFVCGGGSAFDSTLVHFLTDGVAETILERISAGCRCVFCVKPMRELQTALLSVKEVLLVFERSIQRVLPGLRLEHLFTDIVVPAIPAAILSSHANWIRRGARAHLSERGQAALAMAEGDLASIAALMQDVALFSKESQRGIDMGVIKPAKLGTCCPMPVAEEDLKFCTDRGITVHVCDQFGLHEGSIHFDPREIVRLMARLAPGSSARSRLTAARVTRPPTGDPSLHLPSNAGLAIWPGRRTDRDIDCATHGPPSRSHHVLPPPVDLDQAARDFRGQLWRIPVVTGPAARGFGEEGICLGVDFGGTWLRAAVLEVHPGRVPRVLTEAALQFAEHHKDATRADPFALVARFLKRELDLDSFGGRTCPVGISFAQPCHEMALGNVQLTDSVKGWRLQPYVGQNLFALFGRALVAEGLSRLKLGFIANDVVCAHLSSPENAEVALIIGTGFAFSYKDAADRICTVEAGEFIPACMDGVDLDLLVHSEPRGRRAAEKMISGRYVWLNSWLRRHPGHSLGGNPDPKKASDYSSARIGDPCAKNVLDRAGTLVAAMLKAVCPTSERMPLRIVGGGTLMLDSADLRASIERALAPNIILRLTPQAALEGAARAALRRLNRGTGPLHLD